MRHSSLNKESWAKRKMMHTTGTILFAQIRHKYKQENRGVSPNRCTMFEITHVTNSGKPQDPGSKQAIALIKGKIEKMKSTKRASQLPDDHNNFEINEVYTSVLGNDRRGAIRGFGIGVSLDQVDGVPMQKRGIHLEVQELKEQHQAEIEATRKESQAKEDKLREEMDKQQLATIEKLNGMEVAMKNQNAIMALLLGEYEPRDLLATMRMKTGPLQPSVSNTQPSYEQNMNDLDNDYIPQCFEEELHHQVPKN